ncbi:DMT family transporter [Afifella sp. JA880]|uniref:DMT family transporter n=1 Tax=Afifella sp. JA880 TaxID=2975280 RepID=UPI0021BA87A7|nr:DMT family transporter [Afifella sp. JA880]MCT8268556.1 DMT family transporter [Afifella sp. JA880]
MVSLSEDAGAGAAAARLRALLLIMLAFLCFACLDTTAKYLGQWLPAMQIVWVRFLTHFVLTLVIFRPWRDMALCLPRNKKLQVARACCLVGSTLFNFLAVRHLQLAQTVSIFFIGPFIVTALAGPMLGEWAGPQRWAAVVVGFIGALIIIQPVPGAFEPAMLLSVGAATSNALYVILTRQMAGRETAQSMIVMPAVLASFAIAPLGIAQWETVPSTFLWGLLIATGFFGGLGHWLLIKAHELAPATLLAPFVYSEILWITALGFVIFGDVPPRSTVLGGAIIILSGLFILYRERRTRTPPSIEPRA